MNGLRLLGLLSGLLLAGCGNTGAQSGCIDNGVCDEGEACLFAPDAEEGDLGTCQEVECLASDACKIGEYCDTETYVCRAGCQEDDDCRAGQECDVEANTCIEYGCRDTQLDCDIGEFCNEATGECVVDNAGHCDTCMQDLWSPRGSCSDPSAFCLGFEDDPSQGYCFVSCSTTDDCPRGYDCLGGQDFDADGREDFVCSAYCPLLYELGVK